MNKLDQLFIRACKHTNSDIRIISVYRRFYLSNIDEKRKLALINILGNICDKYLNIEVMIVIYGLDTNKIIKDDRNYNERVYDFLVSKIRLTEKSKFPDDMIIPIKYRENI